jgi:hypothetical protein
VIIALWLACATSIDAPPDVAWDRVVCDECAMTVSDPAFAAQLVTKEGDLRVFDDPGCAFRYIAEHHPRIAHLWFHDATDASWHDWDAVEFVPASGAPMNGGFVAVSPGTGGISFSEASGAILSKGKP